MPSTYTHTNHHHKVSDVVQRPNYYYLKLSDAEHILSAKCTQPNLDAALSRLNRYMVHEKSILAVHRHVYGGEAWCC